MRVVAVIPARRGSRRFPGKALHPVGGMPLVQRVATAVQSAGVANEVIVATDDQRIAAAVATAGVRIFLSHEPYRSGSDRAAAAVAALDLDQDDAVLDVQGDEAGVGRAVLLAALSALDQTADIGTVARPLEPQGEREDPDVVKVEIDPMSQRALSFGRRLQRARPGMLLGAHVGVYAYRAAALRRFARLPPSAAEIGEDLEQLRAMDAGMCIGVALVAAGCSCAINRREDVTRAEALLAARCS